MAALVQTLPQQTTTVTMLPPGPSPGPGAFPGGSSAASHQHRASRSAPLARPIYGSSTIGAVAAYRGQAAAVAPYAFTTTPGLAHGINQAPGQNPPHMRQEHRTHSAPAPAHARLNAEASSGERLGPTTATTTSSSSSSPSPDDMSVSGHPRFTADNRPLSMNVSTSGPLATPPGTTYTSSRPAPERYRRGNRRPDTSGAIPGAAPRATGGRSALPSGSGMATVGHLYDLPSMPGDAAGLPSQRGSAPAPHQLRSTGAGGAMPGSPQLRMTSVDDMQLYRPPRTEPAKRYRRQSTSGLDRVEYLGLAETRVDSGAYRSEVSRGPTTGGTPNDRHDLIEPPRPRLDHRRTGSGDSTTSARSSHSRTPPAKHEPPLSPLTPLSSNPVGNHRGSDLPPDARLSQFPPRSTLPSPLSRAIPGTPESHHSSLTSSSRPHTMHNEAAGVAVPASGLSGRNLGSPAAQQLAELNEKDPKKGVKSRLRRALSFGSAAELRRASAENSMNNASAERAKLRKERYQDEREAEQAAIAQKQEAGGIGESIYSGQGGLVIGSTDNVSISSTASSASIMIRKMGKGMKKSTRSLVGLFRPKSVIGTPAADAAAAAVPGASAAQVSMVTVEAERERVNVNVNPHDQVGGGTGYPKLERNSMDAAGVASAGFTQRPFREDEDVVGSARSRRSIIGGEFERAEVLAAVKKGILKRTGTGSAQSSPITRPVDARSDYNPPPLPHAFSSPHSSVPNTPAEDHSLPLGHRRTDSVRIEGEDYFAPLSRPGLGGSKSAPDTPQGMANRYGVTFSPRIQFHDTWPSGEYDRRGETATCNRLTPMLAQQIKEELNTFKMEMDVHESSKVYTHFF